MSREKRRPANRRPSAGPAPWCDQPGEPDLMGDVAAALVDDHPITLMSLVSSLLAALEPQRANPFDQAGEPDLPTRDELVRTFLDVDRPETSALLAVIAQLSGDDIMRQRIRRAITERAHSLPGWLTGVGRATIDGVVEMVHVLGDGDNIMLGMSLPGGGALSIVVYIDHNMGTLVKDAFVVAEPLDTLIGHMRAASGDGPDTTWAELDPADARVRIREAIERGAITFPPFETESWPGCRPLVEWAICMLPTGGTGYQRPHWSAAALRELSESFFTSSFGRRLDDRDRRGLLESLLWFGTGYGPGDPLRWSPVAVELLLIDWIPRKIVADASYLAKAPDLLRAFIRFCHHERGIRAALTTETLAAVEEYEPEYQHTIRSSRAQGPAALLAAMGTFDPDERWPRAGAELLNDPGPLDVPEIVLGTLRRALGSEESLAELDGTALPDEPFVWGPIPGDIHERVNDVLLLVDRCCEELLDVEYRTACRRFLSRAAAGDPEIFRRRGRTDTAAAAICWIIGKANDLFSGTMLVKDLMSHFGRGQGNVSQRSEALLRAIGVDPHDRYGSMNLGSPEYLTSTRREQIRTLRDHYQALVGSATAL
ncbi:MAG: DUF6398 domain-containing protein [Pseudonocardiaceae bacterium]